jgi:hypothetical protein
MMPRRPPRLPSIEAQTAAFIDSCKRGSSIERAWLSYAGFYAYLRYSTRLEIEPGRILTDMLTVANVEIPLKLQRRGWFWRYLQLCAALNAGRILVESVVNPYLRVALQRHAGFEGLPGHSFLLRQDSTSAPVPAWMRVWPGEPKDHRSMPILRYEAPPASVD